MPKYIIKQYETVVNSYEVKADDMTEALVLFRCNMAGDFIRHEDVEPEANNEIGMSFDDAPEEIDLDRVRCECNNERNSEYIESIHSIEVAE